jgi:ornithine cyclodeaminase
MGRALGIPARVAASPQELVGASDVVVTATPAWTPLIDAACLHPRLHITAVGSDAADKNELAPEVLARAGRFVCDRHSQSVAVGELRSALAAGLQVAVDELGEICAGRKPGRRSEDEITVCDLTGTGLQDTAIAVQAWRTARERGLGTVIAS